MLRLDTDAWLISKLPGAVGLLENWTNSYPYVGSVCAVPTVLNPARVLSCQNFNTPVVWS